MWLLPIGGVSTHPRYRGRGLMRALMRRYVEEIRGAGYPLSWLSGRRPRYRHFGYEQCGTELRFTLEREALQAAGIDGTGIGFRRLTGDDLLLAEARRLHAEQPMRCERPPDEFIAICSSWNNRPYAAVAGGGLAGYLIAGGDGSRVTELVAADVVRPCTRSLIYGAVRAGGRCAYRKTDEPPRYCALPDGALDEPNTAVE